MSPNTLKAFCCQWNSNGHSDGLVLSNNFTYSKWDDGPKCPAYFQRVQRPTSNIFLILSCISSNEIARTWALKPHQPAFLHHSPPIFKIFNRTNKGFQPDFPLPQGISRRTPCRPRTPSRPPCSKVWRRRRATWLRPGLPPGQVAPLFEDGAFGAMPLGLVR